MNICSDIASIAPLAMHQPNQKPKSINSPCHLSSDQPRKNKKIYIYEKYRNNRRLYPSSPPVADDRLPSNLN